MKSKKETCLVLLPSLASALFLFVANEFILWAQGWFWIIIAFKYFDIQIGMLVTIAGVLIVVSRSNGTVYTMSCC